MEVMLVLIGFSLLAAAGFLVAFIWALRRGQFDDLTTPAIRMLFESHPPKKQSVRS
jgi:cbb3-type cytochrome oxidase maturation protein